MNENLNLVEILKDCPKGTKFYTSMFGEVKFEKIHDFTIVVFVSNLHFFACFTKEGFYHEGIGECTLLPSKEQRDWSKFTAPWYKKKDRFNPKTLKPFDKVLVRLTKDCIWNATFFSHYDKEVNWGCYPFVTTSCKSYDKCIPYNDETKHLVGTSDDCPDYYKWWED